MNYLSVCSGVEAATVAWHDLGWTPLGFSEIEKFPNEVLAHHYPDVPNLGDMTNYKEWAFGERSVDVVVGGTPCQSFSVAGLRKGMEDPRGNLALIFCGILNKFRPKWFVWENVPGVLSSNKGRDFGSFITAVAELRYGASYRVLDAQNFGVPQRRRRVFVVGHLGAWEPTAEVLFEPESLSRHIEESRKKRKDTPKDTRIGVKESSTEKIIPEVFENHPADSRVKQMGDTCHSVTARWGTGGGNVPFVIQDMAVRKLTPIECERLQGFPDGYTDIKENCPDGPRYKAMGNSMAVPVMKWIGERIESKRIL